MIDLINNEIASFIDSIESVDEDSLNKIRNRYASSITEDLKNGHYTSNICMVLASNLKLNPKELSTTLVEKLNNLNIFEKVESAGPGFINITLKRADFLSTIKNINSVGEKYGRSLIGEGKKVQIEFVSANPTGPLHVGHGRGAAYGDAIARILTATGSEVEKEYYINDAGNQIEKLVKSSLLRYNELVTNKSIDIPDGLYPGEYLKEVGKTLFKKYGDELQLDDKEKVFEKVRSVSLEVIMNMIKNDLLKLGIEMDVFTSEKEIISGRLLDDIFKILDLENFFNDNDNQFVNDIKDLLGSEKNDITFFHSKKYKDIAKNTKASFCITTESLKNDLPKHCNSLIVENVLVSVSKLTSKFYPESIKDNFDETAKSISETKFKDKVKFGKNVLVGNNVSFGSSCEIGHNSIIEK